MYVVYHPCHLICDEVTSLRLLLGLYKIRITCLFRLAQCNRETKKPSNSIDSQTYYVALFRPIFERSNFIRISIPSQPKKWTTFSDIKLIVILAIGCCAGQALLSQWKCNLCSANEEELPCHDSNTQYWKEHSNSTFWQIPVPIAPWYILCCFPIFNF